MIYSSMMLFVVTQDPYTTLVFSVTPQISMNFN